MLSVLVELAVDELVLVDVEVEVAEDVDEEVAVDVEVAVYVGIKRGIIVSTMDTPGGTSGIPGTLSPSVHSGIPPGEGRPSVTLPVKFIKRAELMPPPNMSGFTNVRVTLTTPTPGGNVAVPSTHPGIHRAADAWLAPGGRGEPSPTTFARHVVLWSPRRDTLITPRREASPLLKTITAAGLVTTTA